MSDFSSDKPRTLADCPPPDELTCRRLLVLLGLTCEPGPAKSDPFPTAEPVISEPLDVRLSND